MRSCLAGLAILLGAQGVCPAGTEDPPPAAPVATALNDNSNPYSVISDRNVFHLNPIPPPPEPDKGPPPNLPVVLLSGFMKTGGILKVALAVKTENPDPHGQKLTDYLTLAEGDKQGVGSGNKQGVVELVRIYADQEKVDIINSGTPVTLTIKDDGLNSPAAAVGAARGKAVARFAPAKPAVPGLSATVATPANGENPGGGGSPAVGVPPSVPNAPAVNGGASDRVSTVVVSGGGEPSR
jgi:hypothetical protein